VTPEEGRCFQFHCATSILPPFLDFLYIFSHGRHYAFLPEPHFTHISKTMEFNFFDFEPSPESSIIHPYYQFINGDQTVSSINNPTADRRFPDSVALGSSDKPPGNELQLHPRLAEGVEQLHRTREAKPKRSVQIVCLLNASRTRRDHKPRLIPSNRFGRAGCLRCHHCRKWRQKVPSR
jgi:hypothetical protein